MSDFISNIEKLKECYKDQPVKFLSLDFDLKKIEEFLRDDQKIDIFDLTFIGSGGYGSAYTQKTDENNKVVKITKDAEEIKIAQLLIGKKNNYIADIYAVYEINKKYSIIVLEKLETNNCFLKTIRADLLCFLDEKNLCLQEIIKGENPEDVLNENKFLGEVCDQDLIEIVKSAYCAFYELKERTGVESDDFHPYNMGVKKNGNIGFFDQTTY